MRSSSNYENNSKCRRCVLRTAWNLCYRQWIAGRSSHCPLNAPHKRPEKLKVKLAALTIRNQQYAVSFCMSSNRRQQNCLSYVFGVWPFHQVTDYRLFFFVVVLSCLILVLVVFSPKARWQRQNLHVLIVQHTQHDQIWKQRIWKVM